MHIFLLNLICFTDNVFFLSFRIPFSAVSIGLAIDKTPVVGVVYNFFLDQMFAARKGGGATMNGSSIHVSKCTGV